jgi:hypothetical protein
MQNDTFSSHTDGRQLDRPLGGVQHMDDVLDQLLAHFSAQYPELKIVVVGRTGQSPCSGPTE